MLRNKDQKHMSICSYVALGRIRSVVETILLSEVLKNTLIEGIINEDQIIADLELLKIAAKDRLREVSCA